MTENFILNPQRLTSTTVKVRRLGYISAVPSIIKSREIAYTTLVQSLLKWSQQNRNFLRLYSSTLPIVSGKKSLLTGEITGEDSARRYIETCRELGFITKLRKVQVSKVGKVLSAIPGSENPFELSIGKLFVVLKRLLEKDYDTLKVIYKILLRKEANEMDFFREELEKALRRKMDKAAELNDFYMVDRLKRSIKIMENWKCPERYYFENIKAPRLEWMLDLQFLAFWNKRNNTFRLANNLGAFFEKDIISYEWLNDVFPYLFGEFYSNIFNKEMKHWSDFSRKERMEITERLLDDCMRIFRTVPDVERISADEFFEYSLSSLIQNNSIIAELSDFENDLSDFVGSGELKFRYVKTLSKADRGYILRS